MLTRTDRSEFPGTGGARRFRRDVTQVGEALGEQTQSDTLAGAGVASDQDIADVGSNELDSAQEGIDGGCGVQRLDGDIGAEPVKFQAVE